MGLQKALNPGIPQARVSVAFRKTRVTCGQEGQAYVGGEQG